MSVDRLSDEDVAREALTLDPTRSNLLLLLGGKGDGKSVAARTLFDAWPSDRVVIDPTGDARPDDPHTIAMTAPFLSQLPDPDPEIKPPQTRVTIWARIDPGSPTLKADQNDAVNMALHPRRRHVLIWRDEWSLGVGPNTMSDADRTLLVSSRHFNASAILNCPRPRHMPVLALTQADALLVWSLPNPDDREHVAKNFGVTVPLFEREYAASRARGKHAFLLLSRRHDAILNCPPLPGVTHRGPKS